MSEAAATIVLEPAAAGRLIAAQFPELAGEDVCLQAAKGTDNHIFRIGEHLCGRFPKAAWATGTARREAIALPRFDGAPLPVPKVYGRGEPGEGYGHAWSVLSWLPGVPLEDSAFEDPVQAALQVANFFKFVLRVPADSECGFGADNNWRGAPLAPRSPYFVAALARLPGIDKAWAMRLWGEALRAKTDSAPVWIHGDVHPGNLLIEHGRICGVIDWGLCGVGDGACDLLTAWAMFDAAPREAFRGAMGVSDAEWLRGAGWALSMAVIYLPYAHEKGLRSDMSEKMIERLMEDFT